MPRNDQMSDVLQLLQSDGHAQDKDALKQVFEHYDKDGNGHLSGAELEALWRDLLTGQDTSKTVDPAMITTAAPTMTRVCCEERLSSSLASFPLSRNAFKKESEMAMMEPTRHKNNESQTVMLHSIW